MSVGQQFTEFTPHTHTPCILVNLQSIFSVYTVEDALFVPKYSLTFYPSRKLTRFGKLMFKVSFEIEI